MALKPSIKQSIKSLESLKAMKLSGTDLAAAGVEKPRLIGN
jgi:hypothetical protein